jgi:hypothetical protein
VRRFSGAGGSTGFGVVIFFAQNCRLHCHEVEILFGERFNNPHPVLGNGFPLSPYIVLFREPSTFSDDEAHKRASATVTNLAQGLALCSRGSDDGMSAGT